MVEEQSEARLEPEIAAGDLSVPVQLDPVAVLLAVERIGANVAALGRTLATQPEAVAARLDVDAAAASIVLQVGALGSALDQFRLSLLAAIDRTADRLDAPVWLPAIQATTVHPEQIAAGQAELGVAIAELGAVVARALAAPPETPTVPGLIDGQALQARLDEVANGVADIARDPRLDALAAAVATADPGERLAKVEQAVAQLADGVRASAAIADALDHLGGRLVSIEDAASRVAEDARVLVERVAPVPDRLSAIATQIDRITPLARAGDGAGSLFDQIDQVGARLDRIITMLGTRAGGSEVHARADSDDERFDAVIDVLSGVTRRQDQVTTAIASVIDQVRGPRGVDSVLERMEQRERSLAARLDRIDAELRGRGDVRPGSSGQAGPRPDGETFRRLGNLIALIEQQERMVTERLDQIDTELGRLREATAVSPATRSDADSDTSRALRGVLDRIQQQEETVATQLGWVGDRLAEVAAHLVPDEAAVTASALERQQSKALGDVLAGVLRRQDELAAAIAALSRRDVSTLATQQSPAPAGTTAQAAARRLAKVRAARAQVQVQLMKERLLAANDEDEELL